MAWLNIAAGIDKTSVSLSSDYMSTLQILAFEAAKTMSRLVSLYNSLSDNEFAKLRQGPMISPGVSFLNSIDESYLLGLACKEKLEDLNHVVSVVTRLSEKCIDERLNMFDINYHNMTRGRIDSVVEDIDFNSRNIGKVVQKMEKYVHATSKLHASLVEHDELVASEKKMHRWKTDDIEYFNERIILLRKQVQNLRQNSLWNQTFDRTVGLMSRVVFVVYARICTLFGPFVPSLPFFHIPKRKANFYTKIHPETTNYCLLVDKEVYINQASKSAPIMKSTKIKPTPRRSHSGELPPSGFRFSPTRNKRLIHSAPANTVGSAGLAVHYANLIIMAESCFYSTTNIDNETREDMFEMLPLRLKRALGKKLKGNWRSKESSDWGCGLAEGWIEALEEIIGWLAPVAHDTIMWQQERDLLQQKLDAKQTVLLLQTLYFSDLEKTEAAIVEVLVGLSCIYRYENRREGNCDGGVCWL